MWPTQGNTKPGIFKKNENTALSTAFCLKKPIIPQPTEDYRLNFNMNGPEEIIQEYFP
jgi:hypothetical protein